MKPIVVDASIWCALLIPQDEHHVRVSEWFESSRQSQLKFLAPALLLAEIAGALSRRVGSSLAADAVQALQTLPELTLLEMDRDLSGLAAKLAGDLGLRGADAFYVAVAHHLNIPLATLDIDQAHRCADLVQLETGFPG